MIFSSPSFLWALGLLAIPIIIHLFQFKRYKRLYFSDVSLLKEIQTKSQTKNQLRHLLVLATRMLFLGALVVAFAEPLIPGKSDVAQDHPAISIYVDNSLSMQNQAEEGKLLPIAVQRAFEVIESYPNETKFQLITNELGASQRRFVDKESFLSELDHVDYTANFQPLSRVINFHSASKEEYQIGSSVVYLISDFVNTMDSGIVVSDSNTLIRALPYSGLLEQNISIDSAWLETPMVQAGREYEINFRATNHGQQLRSDVAISMNFDNMVVNTAIVTMEPTSSLDTSITFIASEAGNMRGSVSLEDTPVEFDNTFYFNISVKAEIKVVEISETKQPNSPFAKLFEEGQFSYKFMTADQIRQDSLKNVDFLILSGIENWNSGLFALIDKTTKEGHNVLFTLPKSVSEQSRQNLNTEFGIAATNWDSASIEANRIETNSPLYADVFESQPKNLNYPKVRGHWKVHGTQMQSLLELFDGSALLGSLPKNDAQIFVISTGLTNDWTNFHRHALFVPTMLNMAVGSGLRQSLAHTIGVPKVSTGQRIEEGSRMVSETDSFSFIPGLAFDGLLLNDMVKSAGYHRIVDQENNESLVLAFNYDRRESELNSPSDETLKMQLAQLGNNTEVLTGETAGLKKEINQADLGTDLWPLLLAFALAFLLIESLLIKLFSR